MRYIIRIDGALGKGALITDELDDAMESMQAYLKAAVPGSEIWISTLETNND